MRTRPREDAKHERRNGNQARSFAIDAAIRAVDFHRVWLPQPAAADRPCEVHRVVAVSLSLDWRGDRMGDVPVLTLIERHFRRCIDRNFPRMLLSLVRAEVAQW